MNESELREVPISEKTMLHGDLFDVTYMQVRLPNGGTAKREIVRHGVAAAAIVPVDADGNVYLVEQYRVGSDAITLEIPAGKQDSATEDNLVCAVRELEEETGLHADHIELMTRIYSAPAFCDEEIGIYLATGLSQHRAHLDEDEFIHVVKLPLQEAVARAMRGEQPDSKTVIGLLMAARKLEDAHK